MDNNKPLHWLVASSADPNKISLMIKGLAVAIPSVVAFFTLIGHPIAPDALTGLLDSVATAVTAVLTAVSALVALYGLIRKVFYYFIKR